ncbi:MAG: carbohydrate porin [Pseudoxanthomonas sp.]
MRSHLLATAIATSLGLAGVFATDAVHAQSASELAELKAQIAALQAKVEDLETRSDAQSDVNVEQAKLNETVVPAVDSLKKLVNDTKVGGRIFFDATNISQENNSIKTNGTGTGFDVTRFYLTVDHKFDDVWSANLTSDAQYLSVTPGAGSPSGDGKRGDSIEVFIKKAYVQAKYSDALFLRAGAADTPWIPFVEKYYGYRYVQNTLTDRLSYGSSADWGVHVGGESANGFNYAAAITNGRGYRNPSRSKSVDFEARLGYAPTQNTIVGMGFYSGKRGNETQAVSPPHTADRVNLMAAYTSAKYRLGAEWFQAKNWAVTNVVSDKAAGWSVWASAALTQSGITAFARYDKVDTSKEVNPDFSNAYYHLGVEFPLTKGIKLATVYKQTRAETASQLDTREFGVFGDVQF